MAIKRLDEILKIIFSWEDQLNHFYGPVVQHLKSTRSRKVVELLKEQQEKTLEVLKGIDLREYKNTEYVKSPPDYHSEAVIPHLEITEDSSPDDIFEHILSYEEKLEEYYTHLREILVYQKDRELLDMLIQFKLGQIKRIKSYMDHYDLVI